MFDEPDEIGIEVVNAALVYVEQLFSLVTSAVVARQGPALAICAGLAPANLIFP